MSDLNPEHPYAYHVPGVNSLFPEKLARVHEQAAQIAGRLANGETTDLPDGVLAVLREHTAGIDNTAVGEFRGQIVTEVVAMQSPFDQGKVQRIGHLLNALIEGSNQIAAQRIESERMMAAGFDDLRNQHFPGRDLT